MFRGSGRSHFLCEGFVALLVLAAPKQFAELSWTVLRTIETLSDGVSRL